MFATLSKIPQIKKIWTVTVGFTSKQAADDFLEDTVLSKNAVLITSLKQAAKESQEGQAQPIEKLYKKYGV